MDELEKKIEEAADQFGKNVSPNSVRILQNTYASFGFDTKIVPFLVFDVVLFLVVGAFSVLTFFSETL